jgi:hypothetical protein
MPHLDKVVIGWLIAGFVLVIYRIRIQKFTNDDAPDNDRRSGCFTALVTTAAVVCFVAAAFIAYDHHNGNQKAERISTELQRDYPEIKTITELHPNTGEVFYKTVDGQTCKAKLEKVDKRRAIVNDTIVCEPK